MKKHLLSIQSHVVYGTVGNTAASFPLQLMGGNIVDLRIHGKLHKHRLLLKSYRLLYVNEGYVGSISCLESLASLLETLSSSSNLEDERIFIAIDPVMGDNGSLYVPKEFVPMQKSLLKYADLLTPNQFEAEILSNIKISNQSDAVACLNVLKENGAKNIVITSASLEMDDSKKTMLFGYDLKSNRKFFILYETVDADFTGTGDLFMALLIPHLTIETTSLECPLANACQMALTQIHKVLEETLRKSQCCLSKNSSRTEICKSLELDLVSCKHIFESESNEYKEKTIFID